MTRVLLLCLLWAVPLMAQGVHVGNHTGLTGAYSADFQVSQHHHFSVYAQGMIVRRGDQVAHTVYLRHGGVESDYIALDEAWSHGQKLRFQPSPGDIVCDLHRCLRNLGVLVFTEGEFSHMARSGLALQVIGSEGPIDLTLSAALFSQTQDAARALHLGPIDQ